MDIGNLVAYTNLHNYYAMMIVLGIGLIILEAFIPGGIAGLIGAVIIVGAVLMITDTVIGFITFLGVLALVCFIIFYFIYKIVPKEKLNNSLFLFSTLSKDEGYVPTVSDKKDLVGCIGISKTVLRPIGKVEIGGEIYDATSLTDFIEVGKIIEVVKIDGNTIIVSEKKGE